MKIIDYRIQLYRENWQGEAFLSFVKIENLTEVYANTDHLSKNELNTIQKFSKSKKRWNEYSIGRLLGKRALNTWSKQSLSYREFEIQKGIFEQPYTTHHLHVCADLSISHCDGLVACIVFPKEHPMAIDIELVSESKTEVMQHVFSETEKNFANSDSLLCSTIWSARESVSKVLRCGFMASQSILETKELNQIEDSFFHFRGAYEHLFQYHFSTREEHGAVLTVVHPKKSQLNVISHSS